MNMEKLCGTKIPEKLHHDLYKIKNNDEEVKKYGINFAQKLILEILSSRVAHGFHLFTLNE